MDCLGLAGPGSGPPHFGIFRPSETIYNSLLRVRCRVGSMLSSLLKYRDAHEYLNQEWQLSQGRTEWSGECQGGRQKLSSDCLLLSFLQDSERGCRTKWWARVWERLSWPNWGNFEGFKNCVARVGVFLSQAERLCRVASTHSSTPGSDECKRTAHECARVSPSLECRGWHTTEHTDCVVWLAAETQTETANQSSVFFSRQGEESERSGITPPDSRGWSSSVTRGVGSHYPSGLGIAGARLRAVWESVTSQCPCHQKR